MDVLTLYCPSSDGRENSHTITYKNVKEFKNNGDGTITFKTQKYGKITTPLFWRLAQDVPAEAEPPAGAVRAGNRGNRW